MSTHALAALSAVLLLPLAAQAQTFASTTSAFIRGSVPGAYVDVGLGGDFLPTGELLLWELGNNAESARLFLWSDNGGNVQLDVTRGASDLIAVNLSFYAGTLAAIGGTAFSRVGIGGLDVLGASRGFDLDAVATTATPVPEASTYGLMFAGLGVAGWFAHRRRPLR